MLTYIYFVKCPGCEDEHFDFFNDAKDFALSCLVQKPIITQTEVDRNDFGECTDSCDLGTVWSWEDAMGREEAADTPAKSIFTKDDLKNLPTESDPEFDNLDNSVDFDTVEDAIDFLVHDEEEAIAGYEKAKAAIEAFGVEDKKEIFDTLDHIKEEEEEHIEELKAMHDRKPVPEGMTIEQLVEEMEENEDTVECRVCEELCAKSDCHHDDKLGWICNECNAPANLEEAYDPDSQVELEYKNMTATITTRVIPATRLDPEEYEEEDVTKDFTYKVDAYEIADVIWGNFISEDDAKSVAGGLATLEDEDEWQAFLNNNFDKLVRKYYSALLEYYREDAEEAAEAEFQDDYAAQHEGPDPDDEYDSWRDSEYFDESCPRQPVKEELKWHTYKITYTTAVNPDKEQTTTFKTWKSDVEYAWRMSRENIPHSTIKRIELVEELQESFKPTEKVEFAYDALRVVLQGPKRDVDDWDEAEDSVEYSYYKSKEDVATDIWENFIEEADAKDIEGGLEALEDDKAWNDFLSKHFDDLLDKYYDKLLKYYEDDARKEYEENHYLGESLQKPFLEEFDDAETHKANLTDCPECGTRSYDMKEQYCTNCGLNL